MFARSKYLLTIAVDAVMANRYRSVLTALGIIFGVASVIAMMAIGRGAQLEILEQMKMVGINNIIITPTGEYLRIPGDTSTEKNARRNEPARFSPGLTLHDVEPIAGTLPNAVSVSPEINTTAFAFAQGKRMQVGLTGVTNAFFRIFNLSVSPGMIFTDDQLAAASPVCIIGPGIRSKLFPSMDALGSSIKCGNTWLRITGILEKTRGNAASLEKLGISDYNSTIYIPINTLQSRFGKGGGSGRNDQDMAALANEAVSFTGSRSLLRSRIDKIVVQVADPQHMKATAPVIRRILKRLHNGVEDFQVVIPELVLKQEKRTRNIFNIVLSAIAGISLLVGGIGIMNIMMTSVVERTKEIGIRLSIGAKKKDIIFQFLAESAMISLTGGLIGILLGVILSLVIRYLAGIPTIITLLSVLVSFVISVSVGIVFGYLPAKRASRQDPVASLRYE